MPALADGTATQTPQDESRARYYRMRTPADGRVDWAQSNVQIYHLVRALVAPWPGAFTTIGGTTLVIRQSEPLNPAASAAPPGTVVRVDQDGPVVSAGQGQVKLLRVEAARQPVNADELYRLGVVPGARFK